MLTATASRAAALLLSLHVLVEASPLVASRASLTSRAASTIPGWQYSGCFLEPNGRRALTGSEFYTDSLTVQRCANHCSAMNLPVFGVEYGRECFCGRALDGATQVAESECSQPCGGNAAETCGSGNRMNVYTKIPTAPSSTASPSPVPTTYNYQGCYTEATDGRALVNKNYDDNAMTIELCATQCRGYKFFGLEYYYQCFCGNELSDGSVLADSSECQLKCTGDQSQICGGNNRLSIYGFGTYQIGAPPPETPYPGYNLEGCFTEATGQRALSGASFANDGMTIEICAATCADFAMFGVQGGRDCHCGDVRNAGSDQVAMARCSTRCGGNPSQRCGGNNVLNIYANKPDPKVVSSSTYSSSTTAVASSSYTTTPALTSSSAISSASPSVSSTTTTATTTTTTTTTPAITSSSSTTTTTTTTTTSTTTTTVPASPIVTNGYFGNGFDNWEHYVGNQAEHSIAAPPGGVGAPVGNKSIRMYSPQIVSFIFGMSDLRQTVDLKPGTTYKVSMKFYVEYGPECGVSVYLDSTMVFNTRITSGAKWQVYEAQRWYAATKPARGELYIGVQCGQRAASLLWYDDVAVVEVPGVGPTEEDLWFD